MNSNQNYRSKFKLYVFVCLMAFAVLPFASCSNKGKGDTTTHNDTSSAVTKLVDTAATDSGTKQP